MNSAQLTAVLQALFVTFLWSTSWVLIKLGLADLPPLTFAGLRYTLAFLCLLPVLLRREGLQGVRQLQRADWMRLLLLGVLFYTVTQGAVFVSLNYAPAVTSSLVFSFTAVAVALLGIIVLREVPTGRQWLGVLLALGGALVYFYPFGIAQAALLGVLAAVVGMLANSMSSVLGRYVNRSGAARPLTVTVVSMGIGSLLLLAIGISVQGLPPLSLQNLAIIAWLAVVNTAFAFTLWNHTLRTLSAMESTVINNTMTVQIAILAVVFLGERLSAREVVGLALVVMGTLLVQLRRAPRRAG